MEFRTTDVPTKVRAGRQPLENPFAELFPTDEGKAIEFVVEQGRDSLEARRMIRQARQAAASKGFTGRIVLDDLEDGGVRFTVWTTDKIVRRRKS